MTTIITMILIIIISITAGSHSLSLVIHVIMNNHPYFCGHCRVGEHPLVRLALHPPLEGRLQLGATLAGTLDFRFSQEAAQQSSSAPRCVQLVAMLESQEVVPPTCQPLTKRLPGPVRKVWVCSGPPLLLCSNCPTQR